MFILFVVTIGILGGNIFNVFFLKAYDKKVESIKNSNAKLVPIITTAMFLGLYGTMAAPHFTNIANIPAVAAILVAGITSIFVNKFAANHKKLKDRNLDGIGETYVYETDGYGNDVWMDDANVPNLLSMPWLGWCSLDDARYQNTRKWILSSKNPFYYEGMAAKGIGSPHTPSGYIWHIALSMQGLTSDDESERRQLMETLLATDAGTHLMHEGFDCNNPDAFTREWFAWSNSLFALYAMTYCGLMDVE